MKMSTSMSLSPWTSYSFSVVARNSIGVSDRSTVTSSVCTTPPSHPTINPQGVCTRNSAAVRETQLVIVWQVCHVARCMLQYLCMRFYIILLCI